MSKQNSTVHLSKSCELDVLVLLPPGSSPSPITVSISLKNPRLLFLRKFLNNLMYSVNILIQPPDLDLAAAYFLPPDERHEQYLEYKEVKKVQAEAKATEPAVATAPVPPGPSKSPVIVVQVSNLLLLMPASAVCKAGPIKHVVRSEAVQICIDRLQLAVPGAAWEFSAAHHCSYKITKFQDILDEHVFDFFTSNGFQLQSWMLDSDAVKCLLRESVTVGNSQSFKSPKAEKAKPAAAADPVAKPERKKSATGSGQGPPIRAGMHMFRAAACKNIFEPLKQLIADVNNVEGTANESGVVFLSEQPVAFARKTQDTYERFEEGGGHDRHKAAPPKAGAAPTKKGLGQSKELGAAVEEEESGEGLGDRPTGFPTYPASDPIPATLVTSTVDSASPMLLFSAKGFSVQCCDLVPGAVSEDMEQNVLSQDAKDPRSPGRMEEMLRAVSDWGVDDVQRILLPVELDGALFTEKLISAAMYLHLSFSNQFVAQLGPKRYDSIIRLATGNMLDGVSCFEHAQAAVAAVNRAASATYNYMFSENMSFGPREGGLPWFMLTLHWDNLQLKLKNDPVWWDPHYQNNPTAADTTVSIVDMGFQDSSMCLGMMKGSNDMHLSYQCQALQIYDVRNTSTKADAAPGAGMATPLVQRDTSFSKQDVPPGSCSKAMNSMLDNLASNVTHKTASESNRTSGYQSDNLSQDIDSVPPVVFRDVSGRESTPAVCIFQSTLELPFNETSHLEQLGDGYRGPHDCFKVSVNMLNDGTMAIEVDMCHTLLQWPYLTDMSLVSAIVSIFQPGWGGPPASLVDTLQKKMYPWMYFNIVMRNSEIYIPVMSSQLKESNRLQKMKQTSGSPQSSLASRLSPSSKRHGPCKTTIDDVQLSWEALQEVFHRVTESTRFEPMATKSLGGARVAVHTDSNAPADLKDQGLALSMTALRFGYFAGGDGESRMVVDIRNAAGFVRERDACVTNFLPPIKQLSLNLNTHFPKLDESLELIPLIMLLRRLSVNARVKRRGRLKQREIRTQQKKAQQQKTALDAAMSSSAGSSSAPRAQVGEISAVTGGEQVELPAIPQPTLNPYPMQSKPLTQRMAMMKRVANDLYDDGRADPEHTRVMWDESSSSSRRRKADASAAKRVKKGHELLLEQAWRRAKDLFSEHNMVLPVHPPADKDNNSNNTWTLGRHPSKTEMTFAIDTCTLRGAFSHIPLWHAFAEDIALVKKHMAGPGMFPPSPLLARKAARKKALKIANSSELQRFESEQVLSKLDVELSDRPDSDAEIDGYLMTAGGGDGWDFRQNVVITHVELVDVAFLLCNDKPNSFGAPDVLLVTANNSSTRWEKVLEPWPVEIRMSNPINPIFKDARTQYVQIHSQTPLHVSFHPASLLSVGDALEFGNSLYGTAPDIVSPSESQGRTTLSPGTKEKPCAEDKDKQSTSGMSMGLLAPIMSRVPQRCLINNQTGVPMWYWAPPKEGGFHVGNAGKHRLLPGKCEEMHVTPQPKYCKLLDHGGYVITRVRSHVINIKLEGNWAPIADVSIDVVGKYKYHAISPGDDVKIPLIVDVVLEMTSISLSLSTWCWTKILKLHSALWVQNGTDRKIGFRLHMPSARLALQISAASHADTLVSSQDIHLRSLKPGQGRFLSLLACLGGVLYVEPNGYLPSCHDVIRLSPLVSEMWNQEGYIACEPVQANVNANLGNVHFSVKVGVPASGSDGAMTGGHNVEIPAAGELLRASRPFEAQIKVMPTLVLNNSLPYMMEGYMITIKTNDEEFDPHHYDPPWEKKPTLFDAASGNAATDPVVLGSIPEKIMEEPETSQGGSTSFQEATTAFKQQASDASMALKKQSLEASASIKNTASFMTAPGVLRVFGIEDDASTPSVGATQAEDSAAGEALPSLEEDGLPDLEKSSGSQPRPSKSGGFKKAVSNAVGAVFKGATDIGVGVFKGASDVGAGVYKGATDVGVGVVSGAADVGVGVVKGAAYVAGEAVSAVTSPTKARYLTRESSLPWYAATVEAFVRLAIALKKKPARDLTRESSLPWYVATVDAFVRLAIALKKKPDHEDVRKQIFYILRCELSWAMRPNMRECQILFRTDPKNPGNDHELVSWQDLHSFIMWALASIKMVTIGQGCSRYHYLDLSDNVHLALRVPRLSLQSDRPLILNHDGIRHQIALGENVKPNLMNLPKPLILNHGGIRHQIALGENVKPNLMNLPKWVKMEYRQQDIGTKSASEAQVLNKIAGSQWRSDARDGLWDIMGFLNKREEVVIEEKTEKPDTKERILDKIFGREKKSTTSHVIGSPTTAFWQENPEQQVKMELWQEAPPPTSFSVAPSILKTMKRGAVTFQDPEENPQNSNHDPPASTIRIHLHGRPASVPPPTPEKQTAPGPLVRLQLRAGSYVLKVNLLPGEDNLEPLSPTSNGANGEARRRAGFFTRLKLSNKSRASTQGSAEEGRSRDTRSQEGPSSVPPAKSKSSFLDKLSDVSGTKSQGVPSAASKSSFFTSLLGRVSRNKAYRVSKEGTGNQTGVLAKELRVPIAALPAQAGALHPASPSGPAPSSPASAALASEQRQQKKRPWGPDGGQNSGSSRSSNVVPQRVSGDKIGQGTGSTLSLVAEQDASQHESHSTGSARSTSEPSQGALLAQAEQAASADAGSGAVSSMDSFEGLMGVPELVAERLQSPTKSEQAALPASGSFEGLMGQPELAAERSQSHGTPTQSAPPGTLTSLTSWPPRPPRHPGSAGVPPTQSEGGGRAEASAPTDATSTRPGSLQPLHRLSPAHSLDYSPPREAQGTLASPFMGTASGELTGQHLQATAAVLPTGYDSDSDLPPLPTEARPWSYTKRRSSTGSLHTALLPEAPGSSSLGAITIPHLQLPPTASKQTAPLQTEYKVSQSLPTITSAASDKVHTDCDTRHAIRELPKSSTVSMWPMPKRAKSTGASLQSVGSGTETSLSFPRSDARKPTRLFGRTFSVRRREIGSMMASSTGDLNRMTVSTSVSAMQWGITKLLTKGGVKGASEMEEEEDAYLSSVILGGGNPFEGRDIQNQGFQSKVESTRLPGLLCPKTMFLGVENRGRTATCTVNLYAPIWVDNDTGMNLIFKDIDVPSAFTDIGFLVYHNVKVPGDKKDAITLEGMESLNTAGSFGNTAGSFLKTITEAKNTEPGLLNQQSTAAFRLDDVVGVTVFCPSFRVGVAGQRMDIDIKGPPEPKRDCLINNTRTSSNASSSSSGAHTPNSGRKKESEFVHPIGYRQQTSVPTLLTDESPVYTPIVQAPVKAEGGFENPAGCASRALQGVKDILGLGPEIEHVERLYCFSLEVWAPPGDSAFSTSKVLTIKNKYIILNDTGIPMEYKQYGTPDSNVMYGKGSRFAGRLPSSARIAHHWDDSNLGRALVIRPADLDWQWSGSFELVGEEKYFGLKIRRTDPADGSMIIPISITVGATGSVLVTLKSEGSVPPYMVLNRCKDVVVHLRQADLMRLSGWDRIDPLQKAVPFAWDEPDGNECVEVLAAYSPEQEYSVRGMTLPAWQEELDVDVDGAMATPLGEAIPLGEVLGGSKPGSVHILHVAQQGRKAPKTETVEDEECDDVVPHSRRTKSATTQDAKQVAKDAKHTSKSSFLETGFAGRAKALAISKFGPSKSKIMGPKDSPVSMEQLALSSQDISGMGAALPPATTATSIIIDKSKIMGPKDSPVPMEQLALSRQDIGGMGAALPPATTATSIIIEFKIEVQMKSN
eukprot:gene5984-5277_t